MRSVSQLPLGPFVSVHRTLVSSHRSLLAAASDLLLHGVSCVLIPLAVEEVILRRRLLAALCLPLLTDDSVAQLRQRQHSKETTNARFDT